MLLKSYFRYFYSNSSGIVIICLHITTPGISLVFSSMQITLKLLLQHSSINISVKSSMSLNDNFKFGFSLPKALVIGSVRKPSDSYNFAATLSFLFRTLYTKFPTFFNILELLLFIFLF